MVDKINYLIMVPMVYLAVAVFVIGLISKAISLLRAPRHPAPLHLYPLSRTPGLSALWDTFAIPQVRKHDLRFWIWLMGYHLAFLVLVLAHLDLFPGVRLMPADSPHMLGWGAAGVVVTLALFVFLFRRFRPPVRDISTLGDYLLLMLLIFLCLTGDTISWANSWNQEDGGFVLGKEDFAAYLQSLLDFKFEDPLELLEHAHYVVLVIHVFLANLLLMVFPFTKLTHTFLAMPINRLRRG
jgi:[DsrC]-trisulfide reductase subunit M